MEQAIEINLFMKTIGKQSIPMKLRAQNSNNLSAGTW